MKRSSLRAWEIRHILGAANSAFCRKVEFGEGVISVARPCKDLECHSEMRDCLLRGEGDPGGCVRRKARLRLLVVWRLSARS